MKLKKQNNKPQWGHVWTVQSKFHPTISFLVWGPLWAAPIKSQPFSVSVVDNPGMTSERSDAWHGYLCSFSFPLPAALHVQLSVRSYFTLMEFSSVSFSTAVCFSTVEGWDWLGWGLWGFAHKLKYNCADEEMTSKLENSTAMFFLKKDRQHFI